MRDKVNVHFHCLAVISLKTIKLRAFDKKEERTKIKRLEKTSRESRGEYRLVLTGDRDPRM